MDSRFGLTLAILSDSSRDLLWFFEHNTSIRDIRVGLSQFGDRQLNLGADRRPSD
jgi:hypothetical protein